MYHLFTFFREAVYEHEHVHNAVQRSLSTKTEGELRMLRDGADAFKAEIEAEMISRTDIEVAQEPRADDK